MTWPRAALFIAVLPWMGCAGQAADEPSAPGQAAVNPAVPDAAAPDELEELTRRVEAAPDRVDPRRELGEALLAAGRPLEALPHFERAAKLEPGPRSDFDLGRVFTEASMLSEAEEAYGRVLTRTPGHSRTLHNLGNVAMRRGDHATAILRYGQATETDPAYLSAYYHLGEALQASGREDQALAAFLTILEIEPRTSRDRSAYNDAVVKVASMQMVRGDAAQADRLLSQLIRAVPDHPQAHYIRGQALTLLGREADADAAFARHLEILEAREQTAAAAMNP